MTDAKPANPAQPAKHAKHADSRSLKERALEELKIYWIIVAYLWLLLGLFTVFRRLVVAETGAVYLHYGFALVEALIIAKVILIGKMFGFSRHFEDHALALPVLYKSIFFSVLVMLFGLVEHLITGWVRKQGLWSGLHEIAELGPYELASRALMLIVAFIPFFAFWELGRVLGAKRLMTLFFSKPVSVEQLEERSRP